VLILDFRLAILNWQSWIGDFGELRGLVQASVSVPAGFWRFLAIARFVRLGSGEGLLAQA
jgi:hypothetical protein